MAQSEAEVPTIQPLTYRVRRSVVRKAKLLYPGIGAVFIGFAAHEFGNLLLQADYGPVGAFLLPPGYDFW
jgi:hypothetical protein